MVKAVRALLRKSLPISHDSLLRWVRTLPESEHHTSRVLGIDTDDVARQATSILKAILDAQSARQSEIAQHMRGTAEANYKQMQRFMQKVDGKQTLWRLFQADAPFVLGDVTELPPPPAYPTPYVGTLQDGKRAAFGSWRRPIAGGRSGVILSRTRRARLPGRRTRVT